MIVTVLLWIVFFVVDDKARKRINAAENATVVVDLLTITGTVLAVFPLLGIGFFVVIAPRVPLIQNSHLNWRKHRHFTNNSPARLPLSKYLVESP